MVLLQFIVSVCSDHFIVDTQMLTFKKLVTVFVLGLEQNQGGIRHVGKISFVAVANFIDLEYWGGQRNTECLDKLQNRLIQDRSSGFVFMMTRTRGVRFKMWNPWHCLSFELIIH